MRCPRCGAELVRGKDERFEDISEHVSCLGNNPNWDPGLRPSFICKACNLPGFYDEYGTFYGDGELTIPRRYWQALDSNAYNSFFEVNRLMQKDSPGYNEELRQEILKLPDDQPKRDYKREMAIFSPIRDGKVCQILNDMYAEINSLRVANDIHIEAKECACKLAAKYLKDIEAIEKAKDTWHQVAVENAKELEQVRTEMEQLRTKVKELEEHLDYVKRLYRPQDFVGMDRGG